MIITDMKASPRRGHIKGQCANCKKDVFESMLTLDDAYNVWMGKCPHCSALNFLALTSLRGYSSAGMDLALPTDEEKAENNLPADCPTSGPCGKPADLHGTVSGELMHKLRYPEEEGNKEKP